MKDNRNMYFMVTDDSRIDCYITLNLANSTKLFTNAEYFYDAGGALTKMKQNGPNIPRTIIFLDAMMVPFSGAKFLQNFKELDPGIKSQYTIYVVSCKTDESDTQFIYAFKEIVAGVVHKPLSIESFEKIALLINPEV